MKPADDRNKCRIQEGKQRQVSSFLCGQHWAPLQDNGCDRVLGLLLRMLYAGHTFLLREKQTLSYGYSEVDSVNLRASNSLQYLHETGWLTLGYCFLAWRLSLEPLPAESQQAWGLLCVPGVISQQGGVPEGEALGHRFLTVLQCILKISQHDIYNELGVQLCGIEHLPRVVKPSPLASSTN